MQSPYYAHTQNMTQDLDRFYKDLMQNDLFTNLKKYCTILYDVIKAKYYPLIPFGKYSTRYHFLSLYFYQYIILYTYVWSLYKYIKYICLNVNMIQFQFSIECKIIFWSLWYDEMNSLNYLFFFTSNDIFSGKIWMSEKSVGSNIGHKYTTIVL